MGLKDAILNAVSSAITATGDIAESVTYVATTTGSYDTYSGQVSQTTTEYTFNAIVYPFGASRAGGNDVMDEVTADLAILFASKDLAITPDTNDQIIRGTEKYKIKQIAKDPAGASIRLIVGRLI
jgi:hypothetical protein